MKCQQSTWEKEKAVSFMAAVKCPQLFDANNWEIFDPFQRNTVLQQAFSPAYTQPVRMATHKQLSQCCLFTPKQTLQKTRYVWSSFNYWFMKKKDNT